MNDRDALLLRSSSSGGTWFEFGNTSMGGTSWYLVSSGSSSSEGPAKLQVRNNLNEAVMTFSGANVGIGTAYPAGRLDVSVGDNRSLRLKHDLVPTIEAASANANDALAGIMRFRNSLEVFPSSDGRRAGKVDVRNTAGNPTITMDGASGHLSARTIAASNLPAFAYKKSRYDMLVSRFPGDLANGNHDVVDMTIDVPGPGVLFLIGNSIGGWTRPAEAVVIGSNIGVLELKLVEVGAGTAETDLAKTAFQDDYASIDTSTPIVKAMQTVSAAGTKRYKLRYWHQDFSGFGGPDFHELMVWYFPGSLNPR